MKVLLTGTRSPVTLDLVRAFTSCGHEVHAADSLRFDFGARGLSSFTLITAPNERFDRFAVDAQNLVNRLKPDLIVPLCEDIFHWVLVGESQGWPLFAPPLERLMLLHSKYAFIELARTLGLNVPETSRFLADDGANPGGYIFKPEYSRFGAGIYTPRPCTRFAVSRKPLGETGLGRRRRHELSCVGYWRNVDGLQRI